MTKSKKSKKANADNVYAKKNAAKTNPFAEAVPATAKRLNPFEVHVNREKFHILGRTCKHDKGLPGVSRAKAIKKRKETLGLEYQEKHKNNTFRDRRIGRHLSGDQLTEEVMNARFIAEKMSQIRQSSKASRFNLNEEDDILTHRGQTLEEIEQFQDNRSDDDDEETERLDAEFTEAAHFGGDAAAGQAKDRKTAIEDMIMEQKRRKIEIAKEKDELYDLTNKLDSNYKDLVGLMSKMTKNELKAKPAADDYDKALREMIFEPRGAVTDKLLSEEELAQKEKERLEQLENERLKRMQADNELQQGNQLPKHRSADELDDGYFANNIEEDEDNILSYNMQGELGNAAKESLGNAGHNEHEAEQVEEDDEDTENQSSDEDSNEEDAEDSASSAEDDSDENEGDEAEEDNLSDLKVTDSEDEQTESEAKQQRKSILAKLNKKATQKTIQADLPFSIEMPASYEEFLQLIVKHEPSNQATIVERLIKCNHLKLEGVNREKIVQLFAYLLQYINERFTEATAEDVGQSFKILSCLNPLLYDLLQLNAERMSLNLLNVIKQKHQEYNENSKQFPALDTVVYFKMVSTYYSCSDFRHALVTPCYVFIQQVLSRARVRTRQDVAVGLFMCTIALEFAQQSKRFLPAVFNFLLGIVYLSIPKRPIEVIKILPPFASSGPMSKLLALPEQADADDAQAETALNAEDLVSSTFSREFKIKALNTALKLMADLLETIEENIGVNYLAQPLLEMLQRLPLTAYPKYVKDNFEKTKTILVRVCAKKLTKLVPPEKKPKALRLLEPRIETVYDDKRRPKLSKAKEEKVKLLHKLKRETKGAVREIRRDTEFLQKMRIRQQMQSDMERKEKVKRIYQEASIQQGELNELSRTKKKKKF